MSNIQQLTNRQNKFIIGPSHVHESRMSDEARSLLEAKGVVQIDGYCGLPVWSSTIPKALSEQTSLKRTPIWIVSDYKFNNRDYEHLVTSSSLFIDTVGASENVSREFMSRHHLGYLAMHSLNVIEQVLDMVPSARLIFWCLYKRTKVSKTSSYPRWAWYDIVIKRPKIRDHVIDIGRFTNPKEFNTKMICDEAGHPSIDGYALLAEMCTLSDITEIPE